jgi:hypothetical protein
VGGRRHSFELKQVGQAIVNQPTIDVFGKAMALVPAERLLALPQRALEPERVVSRMAALKDALGRAQQGDEARGEGGAESSVGSAVRGDDA